MSLPLRIIIDCDQEKTNTVLLVETIYAALAADRDTGATIRVEDARGVEVETLTYPDSEREED